MRILFLTDLISLIDYLINPKSKNLIPVPIPVKENKI